MNTLLAVVVIIILAVNPEIDSTPTLLVNDDAGLRVFRMLGLLILFLWMWGLDLYVWTRNDINHMYLLGLDNQTQLPWVNACKVCVMS